MKILVDENIPRMTVEGLRKHGHDVRDVRGTTDQGLEDVNLWAVTMKEGRVLITTDRGFTGVAGIARRRTGCHAERVAGGRPH
jgi:predicted nuclease of predicted toxin-antitoxin system